MPEYFTYRHYIASGSGAMELNLILNVNELSVASGLNIQGAAGYSFNDLLSLELKFSGFNNSIKKFNTSQEEQLSAKGKIEWDLQYYSLLPTLLFGQSFNKSTVYINVYSGIGISKLNIKALVDRDFREYEFKKSNVFSWGYGLEYSYSISNKYQLNFKYWNK